MLYTITFKSGAQQEFDLDAEGVIQLVTGFKAVNDGNGQEATLMCGDIGILVSTIAAFGPYIPMAEKYKIPSRKDSAT